MNDSRILVVDDEPQIRRVLRSTLSALGFVVADAESGEAAVEALRAEKFDLILLDINMPGLSGLETCRAIRSRSDVSIIMLTVRDRSLDKIEALDAGADGYVTKPFDVNELLARIRATLRRAPASALGQSRVAPVGWRGDQLSRSPSKCKWALGATYSHRTGLTALLRDTSRYSAAARQDSTSGVGPRLRWRSRVSAGVRESTAQEDRAGSSAATVHSHGALAGLSFQHAARRCCVRRL